MRIVKHVHIRTTYYKNYLVMYTKDARRDCSIFIEEKRFLQYSQETNLLQLFSISRIIDQGYDDRLIRNQKFTLSNSRVSLKMISKVEVSLCHLAEDALGSTGCGVGRCSRYLEEIAGFMRPDRFTAS